MEQPVSIVCDRGGVMEQPVSTVCDRGGVMEQPVSTVCDRGVVDGTACKISYDVGDE